MLFQMFFCGRYDKRDRVEDMCHGRKRKHVTSFHLQKTENLGSGMFGSVPSA
jgi:hypothetical protein